MRWWRLCAGAPTALARRGVARSCPLAASRVGPTASWRARRPPSAFFECAALTRRALYATVPGRGGGDGDNGVEDSGLDYEYDAMASVRHDAAVASAKKRLNSVLEELLPEGAPPAAVEKARQYLQQHPVDSLITAASIQITHVANPETGAEERVSLSPVSLEEALEQARFRRMNLVQMGSRESIAFCRIREEKPWVYKQIAAEMKAVEERQTAAAAAAAAPTAASTAANASGRRHPRGGGEGKAKSLVDHVFRDAVDAHFIGWRSKKICEDIRKGHPVKLTIREFQSAESAMHKLREMSNAVRRHAEEKGICHHFTSIVGNDREASMTLSAATASSNGQTPKAVRHPNEKEWEQAMRRMQAACQKTGRLGTYMKTGALKPRNVGVSLYRTDKYGRRIE